MSELSEHRLEDRTARVTETSTLSPMKKDSIPDTAPVSAPLPYQQTIIWRNVVLLTGLHIIAVYGLIVTCSRIKRQTLLWGICTGCIGGLGVTAGAHRLWTHRAYKAKWPLRVILVVCYSMAGHNPLFDWVRDHRVHHKFSETDADPHNAKRGFFFAHVGWLMMKKHPDVIAKGRQIDMSDILQDPIVTFHRKYFVAMQTIFSFVIPIVTPYCLWGETGFNSIMACGIVRYVCGLNATWLVNSAAHIWGNKPYDRRIMPTENRFVSIVALGEGWHNYHHVFPWDYKAAELGSYAFNITTLWIDFFALFGWAYDRKAPDFSLVRKMALKHGDGTHWGNAHAKEVPHPSDDEDNNSIDNRNSKSD